MAQKRKKTTRKKAAPKKKAPKRTRAKGLKPADIEHFQELLLAKRREIIGSVNEMQDEALKQSRLNAAGDLSSMPIHMADIGSDNYAQEFALDLMDWERKLLREIDEALDRISDGTYGICLGTQKPMSKARLEAKPWARYSVEYARLIEQGLVRGEDTEAQ